MTASDAAYPQDAYPTLYESWVVGRTGHVALHFLSNSGRGLGEYALTPRSILRGYGTGVRGGRFEVTANRLTAQAGIFTLLTANQEDELPDLRQRFGLAQSELELVEDTNPLQLLYLLSGDVSGRGQGDDYYAQEQRAMVYADVLARLRVPVISSEGSAPEGRSWPDLVSLLLSKSGAAGAVGSGLMIGQANGHPFLGLFAGGGLVVVRKGWDATSAFRRPIGDALEDAQAMAGEQIAARIRNAINGDRRPPERVVPRRPD